MIQLNNLSNVKKKNFGFKRSDFLPVFIIKHWGSVRKFREEKT